MLGSTYGTLRKVPEQFRGVLRVGERCAEGEDGGMCELHNGRY